MTIDDDVQAPARVASHGVRPLRRRDLGGVAALFGRVFREGRPVHLPEIAEAIEALYLRGATASSEVSSRINVDAQGRIDGFLGVLDVTMTIGDRPILCGVLGAFMVDKATASSAVGVSLVRGLSRLPHDLFFSDTASTASLAIARACRYEHLALGSLAWMVPLRPAAAGARFVARHNKLAGRSVGLLARGVDVVLPRLVQGFRPPVVPSTLTDREMSRADFLVAAPALASAHALRPTWGAEDLGWFLAQAEKRRDCGPLRIREVLDGAGRRVGAYLIYAAPGLPAVVLQALAVPRRERLVYEALLGYAAAMGAISVGGVASPQAVAGLTGQRGLVFRAGMNAIVRTRDPDVAAALRAGDFLLGGLVGETWASLVVDDFC